MIKKNLLTIIGFKIVWLSCVLGEIYIGSFFGFFVGIFFLSFFFYFNRKIFTIKIIILFSSLGYCFDSLISYFGFYKINAEINFLFLPLWFLVLWPSFCCLLIEVLIFLKNKKLLSSILGMIFGPLSYYAGISLGIVNVSSMMIFLLISFYWSIMMFSYSKFF